MIGLIYAYEPLIHRRNYRWKFEQLIKNHDLWKIEKKYEIMEK